MKRSTYAAACALLATSPLLNLACGGDDAVVARPADEDAAAPRNDAEAGSGFDATIGDAGLEGGADGDAADDGSATINEDASSLDASSDASDAASMGLVTITAISSLTNQPEPGASIVFHDATGKVIGTATTDAKGQASMVMESGGQVTAAFGSASDARLVTIQGVAPGDMLTALDGLPWSQSVTFQFAIPVPNMSSDITFSAGTCLADTPFNFGPPEEILVYPYQCGINSGQVQLSLVSTAGGQPVAFTTAAALLAATGTTNATFSPWTNLGKAIPLAVVGIPATEPVNVADSDANIVLTHADGNDAGTVSQTTGDYRVALDKLDGGTYAASFQRRLADASFVQNEADIFEEIGLFGPLVTLAVATRTSAGTAPPPLDLSTALPAISAASLEAGTDAGTPSISWTSTGPLTSTKGIIVQFVWPVPGENSDLLWTVFAPPTATSVSLPRLPTALAAMAPTATTSFKLPPNVEAVDGTFLPDYAAVRSAAAVLHPTSGLTYGEFKAVVPTLPVDGTLRVSAFGQNLD